MASEVADPVVAADTLEARLVPQVGEPVDDYVEAPDQADDKAYEAELDEIEPAHAAAAARLHTLFAG
jgi:hypothetical protein